MKRLNNSLKVTSLTAGLCLLAASLAAAQETYSPFYTGSGTPIPASVKSSSKNTGVTSILTIQPAATTEETHPFSGSEAQMEELDKLEPINTNLQVAVDVHNLLNRLRSYKNIQKQYNNTVKLHDRTVELLKNSEQCTLDYMGRYFNNPVKVWSGKDMSETPQNHDLRQGLSAWAIALFETAKSAQVSPIDTSDVISADLQTKDDAGNVIDVETTLNSSSSAVDVKINYQNDGEMINLENLHQESDSVVDNLEEQTGGIYFKEPSRQEELEQADRKADLMSLDIGAEVALWMADYLAGYSTSEGPAWNSADLGGAKKRFPVWTDQKTFYGQYLIRKYRNIKEYIKNYSVADNARQRIAEKVFERQKEYMNMAEAQITQAAVQARLKAKGSYNQDVEKALKSYEEKVAQIEEVRVSSIDNLNRELEAKVAEFDKEMAAINQQRDSYMTQISDINAENNKLKQEISDLRQEIAGYENMLDQDNLDEEQTADYEDLKAKKEKEIEQTQQLYDSQIAKRDDLQKLYDEQTQALSQKQVQKAEYESSIQVKIGQANEQAVQEKQQALDKFKQDTKTQEQALKSKNDKIDAAEAAAKAAIGSKSMVTAKQIIDQSDIIVEDAKEIAYENIDKTLAALQALGDDLYRGQISETIVAYHQALIDSLNGKEAQVGGVKLEVPAAKVHDLTNYNVDIVISSYMDEQMRELYLNNYRDMVKNTQVLLTVPLFGDMLKGVYTGQDSQYFVGSEPKKEDFTAPKAMPDYNLPPLREYVRLDYIDLQSIGKDTPQMEVGTYKIVIKQIGQIERVWEKSNLMPISIIDKEKFLTYGGKIPEIWQLMLKDKAFVDSDFYLTADMDPKAEENPPAEYNPLQLGGEMSPLFRGGIYPCVLKNIEGENGVCTASGTVDNGTGVVDVTIIDNGKTNDDEYFMGLKFVSGDKRTALLEAGLPTCQEISAKCKSELKVVNGGLKEVATPYLSLLNKDEETNTKSGSFVSEGEASELGSIINIYSGKMLTDHSFVQHAIGYSPYMQSVVNYGKRMEELSKKENVDDFNAAEQQNDDIYVRAQYNNNQVGDFLEHVELEQKYQQALDDLEEQVNEAKEELYENLRKYGFEPSADFDISKPEDYDLTVKQLKTVKEKYMAEAKSGIDSITTGDSELLSDSKSSYQRVYQGLMMDSDAVVSMTMDVDNLSEFSEQIKTATTNNTVDETYEKNGDESFEETLKALKPAYCAAY